MELQVPVCLCSPIEKILDVLQGIPNSEAAIGCCVWQPTGPPAQAMESATPPPKGFEDHIQGAMHLHRESLNQLHGPKPWDQLIAPKLNCWGGRGKSSACSEQLGPFPLLLHTHRRTQTFICNAEQNKAGQIHPPCNSSGATLGMNLPQSDCSIDWSGYLPTSFEKGMKRSSWSGLKESTSSNPSNLVYMVFAVDLVWAIHLRFRLSGINLSGQFGKSFKFIRLMMKTLFMFTYWDLGFWLF